MLNLFPRVFFKYFFFFCMIMNSIKIPYLPIENFKASEIEDKISSFVNEENEFVTDFVGEIGNDRKNSLTDISMILHGMGMNKYLPNFLNESIDLDTFFNLTDNDLQELGINDIQDREIILKNLKTHQGSHTPLIVSENHLEDLKIAKNVYNELLSLKNYCAYMDLQFKKQKLVDYRIKSDETAAFYLKMLIELALTQSEKMKDLLFNSNSDNRLIQKTLKMYNLTLPKQMEEKLKMKKVNKKKRIFLKGAIVIGFSSAAVLLARYFITKK